jgi:hypothetical protein
MNSRAMPSFALCSGQAEPPVVATTVGAKAHWKVRRLALGYRKSLAPWLGRHSCKATSGTSSRRGPRQVLMGQMPYSYENS